MKTPLDVLESAITKDKGLEITFDSKNKAERFRLRCYNVIRSERRRNMKAFGENKSEFDVLLFLVKENKLLIVHNAIDGIIKDL